VGSLSILRQVYSVSTQIEYITINERYGLLIECEYSRRAMLTVTADLFQFASMFRGKPKILLFTCVRARNCLSTAADAANDAFDA
jgi:Holliday junction resolvase